MVARNGNSSDSKQENNSKDRFDRDLSIRQTFLVDDYYTPKLSIRQFHLSTLTCRVGK